MKKIELFAVKPSDDRKEIYKNLIKYLEKQGIKIRREGKHKKE